MKATAGIGGRTVVVYNSEPVGFMLDIVHCRKYFYIGLHDVPCFGCLGFLDRTRNFWNTKARTRMIRPPVTSG